MNLYELFEKQYLFINPNMYQELMENPSSYRIKPHILTMLKSQSVHSLFVHPLRIQQNPQSILYFRSINCLSQKTMTNFKVKDLVALERGEKIPTFEESMHFATIFNEHMSHIIEQRGVPSKEELLSAYFSTAGTQLIGMWINDVGSNAEKSFGNLMIEFLKKQDYIKGIIKKNGECISYDEDITIEDIHGAKKRYKGLLLRNDYSIFFASEPDVSIYKGDELICAMEIKGGTERAVALERYGATKKSLDNTRNFHPRSHTIYVCGCITEELVRRVHLDNTVDELYDLLSLLSKQEEATKTFFTSIERLLAT